VPAEEPPPRAHPALTATAAAVSVVGQVGVAAFAQIHRIPSRGAAQDAGGRKEDGN
jgi:hypothetical protein